MTSAMTVRLRLVMGLIQGAALYFLYYASDNNLWPATDAKIFACLTTIATIVPIIIIINLGAMRAGRLVLWAVILTGVLAGLVFYDFARRSDGGAGLKNAMGIYNFFSLLPSLPLIWFIVIGVFIAQSLALAGDIERKYIAAYPTYFDVAWKLAVQLNFSFVVVLLFWLVLWTGANLFTLIKITDVSEFIKHRWFAIPATAMAYAFTLHVTDVRAGLVRGIRTLKLVSSAWLLPIMGLFVTAFLITLPFKGFNVLWETHHTSQIMIGAAAWLIFLINTAYQDGTPEHQPPRVLRYAGTLSAVLVLPLMAIGICALNVRVKEYGWTVNLIEVAACLLIGLFYATGYLLAAIPLGPWLHRLEKTNIYTSFVILAVLLAMFTPLADPARLAVADQIKRLKSGAVTPDKFDYAYLSTHGAIYGSKALKKLRDDASTPEAKAAIDEAMLKPKNGFQLPPPPKPEEITANITVYPLGAHLPDSFIQQNWKGTFSNSWILPGCLTNNKIKCEAFLVTPDKGSAPQEIILGTSSPINASFPLASLFKFNGTSWDSVGQFSYLISCKGVGEALRLGQFHMAPATGEELEINNMHIRVQQTGKCPQ